MATPAVVVALPATADAIPVEIAVVAPGLIIVVALRAAAVAVAHWALANTDTLGAAAAAVAVASFALATTLPPACGVLATPVAASAIGATVAVASFAVATAVAQSALALVTAVAVGVNIAACCVTQLIDYAPVE